MPEDQIPVLPEGQRDITQIDKTNFLESLKLGNLPFDEFIKRYDLRRLDEPKLSMFYPNPWSARTEMGKLNASRLKMDYWAGGSLPLTSPNLFIVAETAGLPGQRGFDAAPVQIEFFELAGPKDSGDSGSLMTGETAGVQGQRGFDGEPPGPSADMCEAPTVSDNLGANSKEEPPTIDRGNP